VLSPQDTPSSGRPACVWESYWLFLQSQAFFFFVSILLTTLWSAKKHPDNIGETLSL